jgi:hypothetical protein
MKFTKSALLLLFVFLTMFGGKADAQQRLKTDKPLKVTLVRWAYT